MSEHRRNEEALLAQVSPILDEGWYYPERESREEYATYLINAHGNYLDYEEFKKRRHAADPYQG